MAVVQNFQIISGKFSAVGICSSGTFVIDQLPLFYKIRKSRLIVSCPCATVPHVSVSCYYFLMN